MERNKMGNTHTTFIDIEPYFNPAKYGCNRKEFFTEIHTERGIDFSLNNTPDGSFWIEEVEFSDYIWKPSSHMKDFEVHFPYTENEKRIEKGEGIGVIYIQPIDLMVVLFYNKNKPYGVEILVYNLGSIENQKKDLNKDLGLGYDVLFIDHDGRYHQLSEERENRKIN